MRRPKIKKDPPSEENQQEKRDLSKIDKTILDNFYKLVHTQDHVRLKAAMSTFKILVAYQKRNPDRFNQHLNYCVERLVTGLASSRALARRGYAMLLLEILKHFQFNTEKLLSIGQRKFGNISHETKDNLVAYYLLISVVLESGNFKQTKKENQYVEQMYKLLKQLKFRKSYFDLPVTKLLVRYYDVFKPQMGSEDILERLAEPPVSTLSGIHLGRQTQRNIEGVFRDCPAEIIDLYLEKLLDTFNKEHGADRLKLHLFCAKQMNNVIRRPQMVKRHDKVIKMAKFLILNDLLRCVDRSKLPNSFWNQHNVKPSVELIGPKARKLLRTAYHTTMDIIVSTCDAEDRLKLLRDLIGFTDDLIASGVCKLHDSEGGVAELWAHYMSSLNSHTSLTKKKDYPKILYPITALHLFYGLQILEHGLECKEQLEDLAQSAKDALKNDPSDGSWADVLTDQIIAILSATECHPWIRRLSVSIFGALLPHISETSIDLICDVFKMPEEADAEEEDDDDEDQEDEGREQDEKMDKDSACESEAQDDVAMDTSTPDEDHVRKLDQALEENLMHNRIINDKNNAESDEEEEEEYLDDDQMMKLDPVIADMFKLNRVTKKKKDPSFQLRCLDLVKKIILKKHGDTELIRKVISVIVPHSTKCRRYKELRPISDKTAKIIGKMKGKSNLKLE